MIYINAEDLKTDSYQRFIDESTSDFEGVIDKCELTAIGITKTLLKGRYDVALIFDETEPIRDEFLAEIIVKLTMYKIIGRNAARKVPTDLKTDFDWAMSQLEKINAGKVSLDLPFPTDEDGNSTLKPMFGNNTNKDFYI
ncbi:adaptor protein [Winogradskyella phage Peternella_1]|uniref:Adaptor protein n=1 Tax=Winogradskyella phage Peternella_1 TaxID=2745699 RepID=A0A8E5EBN6_9CAUD|nr:adaptor protein [Winogradskyella phage Peternella_1]QQV91571.1 adaptor protein [Winogradskyella phage Peternella_1]